MGLDPTKAAELNAPYLEAVNQTNGQGLRQFLKTRMLAGLDTQAQTSLQQPSTNALGQTVVTNPIQETRRTLGESNPTNVGVANFGEYQKDLTTRVASATQNEMRLNEAENLMKEFKPGAGSRTYVDIAQKLQAVNAPQSLVDSVAKGDLSAAQSLNKFIAQTVIQAATSTPGTAESINRYIRDNPDIGSDPRALERFFEFTRKQNAIPIEEQQFLLEKAKKGNLNPDTHVAEAQQHILEKFAQKQNTVTGKERGNATYGKYKGHDVVSHDGGKTWEYK
jgi:predicted SnoaL-like aldol condensation-catalyzing enzyme